MIKLEQPIRIIINIEKEHASKNLQIAFDILNNEHPEELTIIAHDFRNTIVITEVVKVENANFIYHNAKLENTNRIEIVFDTWSKPNRRVRITEISFDVPVGNVTLDNMYHEPKIKIEPEIKKVEVNYYDRESSENKTFILNDENVEDGSIYKVTNPFIMNETQAKDVAEWIMREQSRNAEFTIDWRQNPAFTLWDKISVENGYNTFNTSNIVSQQFEYSGYLKGITKTRGVI